jgi:CRISPR system Cascade subunit CasA
MQCYFGVPRRVRLSFHAAGVCDIAGFTSELCANSFRMRPYGAKYDSWAHPLSPYYRSNKGQGWLPVHGQPGGVAWKDWLGLTLADATTTDRRPAQTVSHFRDRRARHAGSRLLRLCAFGYDMDNMKARDWVEATVPFIATDDEDTLHLMRDTATRLVGGTQLACGLLASAVEHALFPNPKDAPGDRGPVKAALWAAMEQQFYDVMRAIAKNGVDAAAADAACAAFRGHLEAMALAGFDENVDTVQLLSAHVRRAVAARHDLRSALRGHGKMGKKLFDELRLPVPENMSSTAKSTGSSRKPRTRTGAKAS